MSLMEIDHPWWWHGGLRCRVDVNNNSSCLTFLIVPFIILHHPIIQCPWYPLNFLATLLNQTSCNWIEFIFFLINLDQSFSTFDLAIFLKSVKDLFMHTGRVCVENGTISYYFIRKGMFSGLKMKNIKLKDIFFP